MITMMTYLQNMPIGSQARMKTSEKVAYCIIIGGVISSMVIITVCIGLMYNNIKL